MDKISISAAGPDKFYWMRMNDKGRTVTALDGSKIKIEAKALFGVREVRGKEYDEILLVTGERFNLSIAKSEALMNVGKEFKGRTPTIQRAPAATKAVNTKRPGPAKDKAPKKIASPVQQKAIPITKLGDMLKAKNKKPTAVANPDTRKATVTKLTGTAVPNKPEAPRNVKVKLSELHLPEVDDFHDTELPEEFRRYKVVESTGVRVQKIDISFKEEPGESKPEA